MTLKTATRTWLALVLAASLALGEGMAPAAEGASPEPCPPPVPVAATPSPPNRAEDLDFSDDFPAPNRINRMRTRMQAAGKVTRPLPPPVPVAAPARSRSWVYWTMGLSAMAAGGAAWYLHWDARTAPVPVRKDQVFTDDPD